MFEKAKLDQIISNVKSALNAIDMSGNVSVIMGHFRGLCHASSIMNHFKMSHDYYFPFK